MPKLKPNKGLLKRIKITKNGKVKVPRAAGRHLRSHKSGSLLRSYRKANYATPGDFKRVKAMLHLPLIRRKPENAAESDAAKD